MKLQNPNSPNIIAHGKSFASFGEIAQGRLSGGEDFLVSLPIDLWNSCQLTCSETSGHTVVETELPKAKKIAELLLNILGKSQGLLIKLTFNRNIPVGKGLSSSTADMLAVVNAFESAYKFKLTQSEISELFSRVEPHDPLHYRECVAYNHRHGKLLKSFGYIPEFEIIGIDRGGKVSTENYNRHLNYSITETLEYDLLYDSLCEALVRKDDLAIAKCALWSTKLHAAKYNDPLLKIILQHVNIWGALGLTLTHSGTCIGVILPKNASAKSTKNIISTAKNFGSVFRIKTLSP